MNQHARVEQRSIPFIDVAAQRRRLGRAIDDAMARVLAHCQFVQGPEVHVLEAELAAFCGARHAIRSMRMPRRISLPAHRSGTRRASSLDER